MKKRRTLFKEMQVGTMFTFLGGDQIMMLFFNNADNHYYVGNVNTGGIRRKQNEDEEQIVEVAR